MNTQPNTPPARLIVFVKSPRVGTVKTRLARALGPEEACEAYRLLVEVLLERLSPLSNVELRFTPEDAAAEIAPWLRGGWVARPQGPGGLGQRLETAFAEAFASGNQRVVVIGSDCPVVTDREVKAAWACLADHDLVIGPARDGGYWLIGLRAPQPRLFQDISWSTPAVLSETLEIARLENLRVQVLRPLADIDTEKDWQEYLAKRSPAR
ncbi:MAG: TIGR04282 family arsenosugar biosynthesis glycosyltransferase [Verrucomicrobiota bacterium]